MTSSGTANAQASASNLVLDGNGSTIDGDIIVNGSYISLKNVTVNGNLETGVVLMVVSIP